MAFNHAPQDYLCPFCTFLSGHETRRNVDDDIVYQSDTAVAYIAPKWWIGNEGHALVIPKAHFENIYDIPEDVIADLYKVVKKVAVAMRSTYDCEGITVRQHNEPAGSQEVWHFHTHIFPRYAGDDLYGNDENITYVSPEARAPYAEKLRAYFSEQTHADTASDS